MNRSMSIQLPKKLSPPLIAFLLALILFFASYFLNMEAGFSGLLNRGQNILHITAFLGIISAGQTLVIISGGEGIDLSIGTTVTLGSIVTGVILNKSDDLVFVALLGALAVGALIGIINGFGIMYLNVHPLVMTLGISGVTMGSILAIYQGTIKGGSGPFFTRFVSLSLKPFGIDIQITGAIFIWILVSILVWFLLNRTQYGRKLYAVGVNRKAAFLSGVRVERIVILAYVISGMFAAFGGFMILAWIQSVYFIVGDAYLFPSIAAVVLGGTTLAGGEGSYWGTISGALVLTTLDSILTTVQVEQNVRAIILGCILIAVISVYGRQRSLRQ